jgi:hypothetical protein
MTRQMVVRAVAVVGLAALLAAGCGDDDDSSSSSSDTTGSSTTAADDTTTTTDLPDAPPLTEDAVSGSGCTPGGDELPDGWWYGRVDGAVGSELSFDLACYYIGAAAESEAASRGDEVDNDYYVVNDNATVRVVPVGAAATASCVAPDPSAGTVDCEPGDVDPMWAVWLRVVDGEVDRIVEQYAP